LAVAAGVTVVVNRQPGEGLGGALRSTAIDVLQGGRPENILLIGNNARHATTPLAPGMADLIYVVHFDPARHEVDVISVPRDTMVAFPGWNNPIPKIKSALLLGGPALEAQAVAKLTGMPIQGYVEADFSGFAAAINAVGGLYVDIPARLYDPTFSHANFEPGYQHLNGVEALAYVRIRQNQAGNGYRVNSFQRSSAGVQVMDALKREVLAHMTAGKLLHLIGVLRSDFATNLSSGELVALLAAVDHAKIQSVSMGHLADTMVIDSTAIPGVNATGEITGAYYDILTPQEIAAQLAPYGARDPQTGLAPLPAPSAVAVDVSDNLDGLLYAQRLRKAGLQVSVGGAPTSAGPILVVYPPGQLAAAEVVGRALGNTNEILQSGPVTRISVETP
jgi:LCP family protein required for cell wall assembly